jgi:hypothetical protein
MSKPRQVIYGKQKAAGIRRPKWIELSSHHMTSGRRLLEFGTGARPLRAHVQNSAVAVSVPVLRMAINGAPLFGPTIMPDLYGDRQGNYRDLSWVGAVSVIRQAP